MPVFFRSLIARLGFAAFLVTLPWAVAAQSTRLVDYTDIWHHQGTDGWGVNLVQSSVFIFATFFVYDAAGNPMWYTSELDSNNENTAFAGDIIKTRSAPAADVLSPSNIERTRVGTASFTPISATRGTIVLHFTADGKTLSQEIQRLTLKTPPIPTAEISTFTATITTKYETEAGRNDLVTWSTHTSTMVFSKNGDGSTLTFTDNSGASCQITGPMRVTGRSYEIDDDSGRYTCTKNGATTRDVRTAELDLRFSSTGGLEGSWDFEDRNDYEEEGYFSAVLQSTP